MEPLEQSRVEDRIRTEFAIAFESLEHASAEEKPRAASRLNAAVRTLYDFVGYGKAPANRQEGRDA